MFRTIISAFVLLASASLTLAESPPRKPLPSPATVCSIFRSPKIFDGRLVNLSGIVFTDYFEYSGIRDSSCSDKLLRFQGSLPLPLGNDRVEDALDKIRSTPSLTVHATVEGVIRYHPNEVPVLVILVSEFSRVRTLNKR
jgi:hypothetical protein